jgi:hypothetical protein
MNPDKTEKLFETIGQINEKIIQEAEETEMAHEKRTRNRSKITAIFAASAAGIAIFVIAAALILPERIYQPFTAPPTFEPVGGVMEIDTAAGIHLNDMNPLITDFWELAIRSELFDVYIDMAYGLHFMCRQTNNVVSKDPITFDNKDFNQRYAFWAPIFEQERRFWASVTAPHTFVEAVFTITYTFGKNLPPESLLMTAMTTETFEYCYLKLRELEEANVIDVPTRRIFNNNYTLISHDIWVDGIIDLGLPSVPERYPAFEELGLMYLLKPVTNRTINDLMYLYSLLDITPERIAQEYTALGQAPAEPDYITFTIIYSLDGTTLTYKQVVI